MKKTLSLAALAVVSLATAAFAQPVTFDFEGDTWTITNSGNGAPVSGIHMTPGFKHFCPQLQIKLDATHKGPGLTKEQKFRGDTQWHVVCDRTAPPAAAASAQAAPRTEVPTQTPPRVRRNPNVIDAGI